MEQTKTYTVEILYQFDIEANSVQEARKKADDMYYMGSVGCNIVTEKDTKQKYIELGLCEEYLETNLPQKEKIQELAECTHINIHNNDTLIKAIERLLPSKIKYVVSELEKEMNDPKNDFEFQRGCEYALELLEALH